MASFTGYLGVPFSGFWSYAGVNDSYYLEAWGISSPSATFQGSSGALPPGISVQQNFSTNQAVVSGTPTQAGNFNAVVVFGQTNPMTMEHPKFYAQIASKTVSFTVIDARPIIAAGQTASGAVGVAFSKTFLLTDSTNRPVTSWAATGLPGWATLNTATGAITGTPQDSGSTTITLTATGPRGTSEATAVTISIAVGPPIIVAGQSFTGKVGEAFTQTPTLDDALDRPATSWSATGLPAGLSLNATTGAITGTPTAKGSFTASFTATGSGGTSAAISVAFTISEGTPIITAGQTLTGAVGTAFSRTPALTDSANRPVTSWSATGLPSWATINAATGAITGTPQGSGSTTITLTATGPGGADTKTATISVISALVITWPNLDVRVGEQVRFFANTGSLPGGIQSGVYYFVSSKLPDGKFTISSTLDGAPIAPTSQTWSGTYRAQLKSRISRSGTTNIQYIGMKLSEGAAWDRVANSVTLWGYDASSVSSSTVSRPLKAEDMSYADLSAMDWVLPGQTQPPQAGTLRTATTVNHRVDNGAALANWPTGGAVLVDLDGRNRVDVRGVTLGELTIVPGYRGRLHISMLPYLDGVRGAGGNLCSLLIKFFATHASSGVDDYRSGGGDAWTEVLAFGPPGDVVSEASVPVTGAYAIYKLVRGPIGSGNLAVSLRMRLE